MTAEEHLLSDRYQVGALLGDGAMAEVHRGRDIRLGRDVAIKMLHPALAYEDTTFLERFRREVQYLAALNHPAIVAVYDTGEYVSATGEPLPYVVMELVDGPTLREVLAGEQWLQPSRALRMIGDICSALEYSHRQGIIHRDIKPSNVLVTRNDHVKIMDFGIAQIATRDFDAVIGTAAYLAPELARGERADARSDVYAAGCLLFELLAGRPPFVGDSPVSVVYQHVREDPKAPSEINRGIPPDVDAIVLKALAKNPLDRYQSAQEMRGDALLAVTARSGQATSAHGERAYAEFTEPWPVTPTAPGASTWRPVPIFPDDIDITPPQPIVTYVPDAPRPEFGGQSIGELEALADRLRQQVDDALRRQDWTLASSLRATESAVYVELLRRSRAAPERGGLPAKIEKIPGRIFLSYRREDSKHVAGRLADRLVDSFGQRQVFIDVDSVDPGADFVDTVRQAVGSCEVLLALIGPAWIDLQADGRRRLDDPEDIVALEIREALSCGVRVIPVLVDGAPMPRRERLPAGLEALTRRNALTIGHETFRSDFDRLLVDLKRMLTPT